MAEENWFLRQMRLVHEEIQQWPDWMKRTAGFEVPPMTKREHLDGDEGKP